ncbi:MAG: HNH endonuclease [Nitrososphaeraceae archaeon]
MSFASKHKGIGYKGGAGRQKRWYARIMVNGKFHNIGHFLTESEAIEAYQKFIEENKDSLPERAKNITKNAPDYPRVNGYIIRKCTDCGREDKFKKVPNSDKCKSCGIKESFRHRPAVGLKEISKEDLSNAFEEYETGLPLEEVAPKYGITAGCLGDKFQKARYQVRKNTEKAIMTNMRYGNIKKMQQKIKDLCKTGEFQKAASARLQGIPVEEWTHFITPENLQYYKSEEFQNWRKSILKRDNYTCQMCQKRGGELHSHHIKPKGKFWDLRTDINNGICLCRICHFSINGKEHLYEHFFKEKLIANNYQDAT